MPLKDEAEVEVRGGRGGDGCVSFRREKYVARGGPNGGDGGDGGDVVFVADVHISSLLDLVRRRHLRAENGRPGGGSNKHGKRGATLEVKVPVGSLIYDADLDLLLADLDAEGARVVVARGGRGGRGNTAFASSTNQVPREYEEGTPGDEKRLRVELKLIADVGLLGLPNAGKSTFLGRVSRARPKVAAYPFTTLEPELGMVELPGYRRLVVADIPGLIEGAHTGHGLGDQFLRHVERCPLLLHLVDLSAALEDPDAPVRAYRTIRGELEASSAELAAKPEVVVGNKIDMPETAAARARLEAEVGAPITVISALTGEGVPALLEALYSRVRAFSAADSAAGPAADPAAGPAADSAADSAADPEPPTRTDA